VLEKSHMILVFFVYGLSFFILGLAVFIYPKKNSIFSLASHIKLIALFGLTHGLNEWIDMYIIVQKPLNTYGLQLARTIILPGSFIFLVIFGVRSIYKTKPGYAFLKPLPVILPTIWFVITILSSDRFLVGDIFARYLICIPGTILTSCALKIHLSQLKNTRLKAVIKNLRLMIVTFLVYGFLAGAVVPKTKFVPASFLNYDFMLQAFGVRVQILRALCAILLAYSMLRVLSVFYWETQHRLLEGEMRLNTVASAASVVLFQYDRDGKLTFLEGKSLNILDLNLDNFIGKPISNLFPDFDHTKLNRNSLATNKTYNCNVSIGDRSFDMCYSPLKGEGDRISGFVGAALDITQRLQAQAEIEEFRNELSRTKRLTELGTMSRALCKELRKPLNVASLLMQRLVKDYESSGSQKKGNTLKKILSEINEASSTVKKLCDYAKSPSSEQSEPLDLSKLLTKVMSIFSERAEQANLKVVINTLDAAPCLAITERELAYVFSSLIENSIISADSNIEQKLTVSYEMNDGQINIIFTDTCDGIATEQLGNVFKPFSSTENTKGDGGLGLAIVNEIIQSHRGSITVNSQEGKGTTFRLTLPLID